MRARWSLVRKTRSVREAVSVLTWWAARSASCCAPIICFMGSPTAPLLCSQRLPRLLPSSLHGIQPTRHGAAWKQSGSGWQNKVDRNYSHNLEVDSDNWRIDGKMHRKSKLSVSPRKTWRKWNNTFQSKSPIHMRLNKPRLLMPPI